MVGLSAVLLPIYGGGQFGALQSGLETEDNPVTGANECNRDVTPIDLKGA